MAQQSYQQGQTCYATAQGAAAAYATTLSPIQFADGGTLSLCTPQAGGTEDAPAISYQCVAVSGTGPAHASVSVPYQPPPCGLLDWQDVQPLAWAVVAVWLAVYAVSFLGRRAVG